MAAAGQDFLQRARLLLGAEAVDVFARSSVAVFGVGGVGSWCAEGLARSGVGRLTLVDGDRVAPSNVNRQLMATSRTLGRVKVDALRERLLEVSPSLEVTARFGEYGAETQGEFPLDGYDCVVDAIDSLEAKALLILNACRSRAALFSSMGAARKMDASRARVAEFWRVEGCPLARALRQRFRRGGALPARKFRCVYSDELLPNAGQTPENEAGASGASPSGARANGSMVHVTAVFGFLLSGLVLDELRRRAGLTP